MDVLSFFFLASIDVDEESVSEVPVLQWKQHGSSRSQVLEILEIILHHFARCARPLLLLSARKGVRE